MAAYRHIVVEPGVNWTVIRLCLPRLIDDPQLDELRREVAAVILAAEPPHIVVDISAVQMVSSAGLSFFRDAYRATSSRQGKVVVVVQRDEIRGLMRMVGLDTIFGIFDDVAAAKAAL